LSAGTVHCDGALAGFTGFAALYVGRYFVG